MITIFSFFNGKTILANKINIFIDKPLLMTFYYLEFQNIEAYFSGVTNYPKLCINNKPLSAKSSSMNKIGPADVDNDFTPGRLSPLPINILDFEWKGLLLYNFK